MQNKNLLKVTEAAKLMDIGRGAILFAIKKGRLPATVDANGMYWIEVDALDHYEKNKWNRKETTCYNGKKIFEEHSEYCTTAEAGNLLGLEIQQIYYLIRRGKLQKVRVGNLIVLKQAEVMAFKKSLPTVRFWVKTG